MELEWYRQKSIERAERILELEAELAALQEANATLRGAMEVASEKLGEARKEIADLRGFIRSIFPLENPSDVRYANQYIQEYISKWQGETEAEAGENAPKFPVGAYVKIAFYGVDATALHPARVMGWRLGETLSGRAEVFYRVWFDGREAEAAEEFPESRVSLNKGYYAK